MRLIFAIFLFLLTREIHAQRILLDDLFDDWQDVPVLHADKVGDAGPSGIDFRTLKMWHTEEYLFLYIETGREINLQSGNAITMYLDTDNRSNTGMQVSGIGAEISYNFGSRGGSMHGNFGPVASIRHAQIGLITSPTVTSDRFEIAINRRFTINGVNYFLQNQLRIAFVSEEGNGDRLPDLNGGVEYNFNPTIPSALPDYSIEKRNPAHIRFVAYNVERDKLFNPAVRQEYSRIFKALKPDIIGFSEIYDNSSSATAALIESMLPSESGQQWYSGGVFPDIRLVSRYPIVDVRRVDGNGIFLLNMGSWRLICIVAHLPCCENETARQLEIDNIMAYVRNIRLGISPLDVPQGTPIIIAGDMNFVGFRSQVNTLMTGDIVNNNIHGPDFRPDWDESDMDDALPYVTDAPFTYTWYSPGGTYSAGRLDYIVYTGSVLDKHNSFSLVSEVMSADKRQAAGLSVNDTGTASDHFPIVMDFSLKGITGTSNHVKSNNYCRVYPNPADESELNLRFDNVLDREVVCRMLTSEGKSVLEKTLTKGFAEFQLSLSGISSGTYFLVFDKQSGLENIRIIRQ